MPFVQFSNQSKTAIVAVFASEQPASVPYQGSVPEDDVRLLMFLKPTHSLPEAKALLKAQIDQQAETQRLRYITGGAGQAMTYAQKAEEARLCLEATAPGAEHYPLLAAEIGITADTLAGVAQVVATANAQWLQIGAAIEAARLSAKKAISEAETLEDAQAAADAVVWP